MSDLTVAVEALRADARRWGGGGGCMADTMQQAATAAAFLQVSADALSWVSVDTGLAATYDQIQQKCVRVLREGADNFAAVSDELRRAADAYEGIDVDNAAELQRVWQLKD